MTTPRKSKAGGWVTMIVLLGLGGLSIYFKPFAPAKAHSEEELTRVTIRRMLSALRRYREIAECYPSEAQGLRAFVSQPTEEPLPVRWEQFFLEVPRDGWGRDFRYVIPASGRPGLISAGKDGEFETGDDIAPGAVRSLESIKKNQQP